MRYLAAVGLTRSDLQEAVEMMTKMFSDYENSMKAQQLEAGPDFDVDGRRIDDADTPMVEP